MRVFDCCMTAGEIDLLEVRLKELAPVVDTFVFVEATKTHSGKPRRPMLASLLPALCAETGVAPERIRIVVVEDMPDHPDPWVRERHQRECILRGLPDVKMEDGVIFSDCDEIPRRESVAWWKESDHTPCKCEQLNCYYWLNCVGGGWGGSIIGLWSWMRQDSLSAIRSKSSATGLLRGAGWHFSFLGGVTGVLAKLANYAHQDVNLPHFRNERWLRVALHTPIDLFRREIPWRFQALTDDFLPHALRSDRERYQALVKDVSFEDYFINDAQLCWLVDTYWRVFELNGDVLEFGSWEGRSSVALANMAYPDVLTCVDSWLGTATGNVEHEPGGLFVRQGRDVWKTFNQNVQELTPGNVRPVRKPTREFLTAYRRPLKFAHIDASHHYDDVAHEIRCLKPLVVPGGVLCGDDLQTACRARADLGGGVERAVEELLPGFERMQNFWIWENKG